MSTPGATTFRFQRPRFLSAVTTNSDVLTEWLCFLLGKTLIDIPAAHLKLCYDIDGHDRVKDFEATLDPADLCRSRQIQEELEAHYDKIWDDDIFRSYNFSDEGFYKYEYYIHPTSISLVLYADGTGTLDY